ncbi:hypothetical protein H4Q26_001950 [Puccinia striiformis f. sp. tritici PST-130]|nr:hypothetical protein H4Q26_001950 [Puccinia striiformis f. sp. tritici PST-130]
MPLFENPLTNRDCLKILVPFNILDPVGLIESEEMDQTKKLLLGQFRYCRACKVSNLLDLIIVGLVKVPWIRWSNICGLQGLYTRRTPQMRRKLVEEAFTYGDEILNPDLIASSSSSSRLKVVQRQRMKVSPYHPNYDRHHHQSEDSDSDSGRRANGQLVDLSDDDDSDVPLSDLGCSPDS